MPRYLAILAIAFIMISCAENKKHRHAQTDEEKLYGKYCKGCHGRSGNLQFSGAANLQLSSLQAPEIVDIITNGQGKMLGYKRLISEDEIHTLSLYVKSLRKN